MTLRHCLVTACLVASASVLAVAQEAAPPEDDAPVARVAARADAAALIGAFVGELHAGPTTLKIVFRVARADNGTIATTMDSPDQGAYGIAFDTTVFRQDSTVMLRCAAVGGEFKGALSADGTMLDGTWTQMGQDFELHLVRGEVDPPNRPQMPVPPFPYSARDVKISQDTDHLTLAGTLTTPQGDGPFPAAILITGSGPQDRDESLMGHKPFLVIADALTRAGIAVLRLDDRGVGASTGSMAAVTTQVLARDTDAALTWLKAQPNIDPSRVGLIGHSEGAMIAPIVASSRDEVAYAVLLAGPSVPGDVLLGEQSMLLSRAAGVGPDALAKQGKIMKSLMDLAKDPNAQDSELAGRMRGVVLASASELPPEAMVAVEQRLAVMASPWMRAFLTYDPAPALKAMRCPTLALYGERDLQVPAGTNAPVARELLSGNAAAVVEVIPAANHLFQLCDTGGIQEYAIIETTIDPAVLERMTAFVVGATKR